MLLLETHSNYLKKACLFCGPNSCHKVTIFQIFEILTFLNFMKPLTCESLKKAIKVYGKNLRIE